MLGTARPSIEMTIRIYIFSNACQSFYLMATYRFLLRNLDDVAQKSFDEDKSGVSRRTLLPDFFVIN